MIVLVAPIGNPTPVGLATNKLSWAGFYFMLLGVCVFGDKVMLCILFRIEQLDRSFLIDFFDGVTVGPFPPLVIGAKGQLFARKTLPICLSVQCYALIDILIPLLL